MLLVEQRINSEVYNPLGVSPSLVNGNREPHEAKKKSFDLGGNRTHDPGIDLPLLCRLSYKVAQRKSGTILDGESRRRESMGTYECCAA